MKTRLLEAAPVLRSQNIERDGILQKKHVGLSTLYRDKMYALIQHENINMHLRWLADTEDDRLPDCSVVHIMVENIKPLFKEFTERKTLNQKR